MRLLPQAVLVAASLASCRRSSVSPSPTDLPLTGVEVTGCGAVLKGPVCRLHEDRKLHVTLPAGAESPFVAFRVADREERAPSTTDAAGALDVVVPAGAEVLLIRARLGERPASRALPLGDAPGLAPWTLEARAARRAGHEDEVMRVLERGMADAAAPRAADAESIHARMVLGLGDFARAAEELEASATLHAALGELSAAAEDERARAHVLTEQMRDFSAAEEALARLAAFSQDYPEGAIAAQEQRGRLALVVGETARGLGLLEEARQHAQRLELASALSSIEQRRALALLRIGRIDQSLDALSTLEQLQGPTMDACAHADLQVNLGWAALLARDAGDAAVTSRPDPLAPLRLAEEAFRTTCPEPAARANILFNLAWGHLQNGDAVRARTLLDQGRAASEHLEPEVALFALDVEGRIELASGHARAALTRYATLAARSAGIFEGYEARAEEGRAEALVLLGDRAGALEALVRAETAIDDVARTVPVGEGRGAFFWSRARVTRRHVALLIDAGRAEEALRVARLAQSRVFADVRQASRVSSLPSDARARWEDTLAAYLRGRETLAADARQDWALSAEALARTAALRRARDVELRSDLTRVALDLFADTPFEAAALVTTANEVALACQPVGPDLWATFRVDMRGTHVDRVSAPTDPARAAEAAASLLSSQAAPLRASSRLRWLALDALHDVDVHALPLDGEPLLAHSDVEYVIDVPAPPATPQTSPFRLVVADPTGTLPGARRDGYLLADVDGGGGHESRLLVGANATRRRVQDDLVRASSFFFSGHATYEGADGWDSALLLAPPERLQIADILTLAHVPALVVLASCEAGRRGMRGGAPGLGLADAFLTAGAAVVLAPSRPVSDEIATRFLSKLKPLLDAGGSDVASIARSAELSLRAEGPASDWSAFRVFAR